MSIKEAAKYLDVHINTIKNWDKKNILKPTVITPGGHRRYSKEDLMKVYYK